MSPVWEKYKHLWQRLDVPAKHLLLREGEVCQRIYLIRQGSIRAWFDHDGKEICFQFFFEGDVVYAPESFRRQVPSPFFIGTLEPCQLYWIGTAGMDTIREDAAVYNQILDKVVERQSEDTRRFFTFLSETPRQRYENLVKNKPEVVQRVPLQYIASYLGITQVSLSRIRNQVRPGK